MRTTRLRFTVALLCAVFAAVASGGRSPLRAAPADFTRYHSYDEMAAALKSAVAAHPDLAKLVSIGKTREGRDIWAVEIAKPAGPPVDSRPGLLIAATFEGDHLIGGELALYTVDYLLNAYATDAAVKQRLDRSVIYVVPRINADGAEQMFAPVKALRRTNATPIDADNDGRTDEDGPEDLNKDGFVTVMRVKDPKGPYMVSPDDARLMKRADPARGESGGWALYVEGIDNDGDGFYNEDGPGGVDINRNFMHQYPYFTPDAGRYMVSETETRALLDYVLAHRNIAAILTFGESDNLVTAGGRSAGSAGLNLVDFAERANAPARRVGMMPDLGGGMGRGGGRGGGGMFMPGAEGGPGPRRAAAGRRARRRRHSAGHERERGRPRVLHGDRRQVPRVDRSAKHGVHACPGGRVLRVRLLPVRRAVVLDAGLGAAGRRPARRARRQRGPVRRGGGEAGWRPGGDGGHDRRVRSARRGPRRRSRQRHGCGRRRHRGGHRPAPPAVDGQREGGRVRQLGALQAPVARRRRNRRLQAVCHRESARREDRGTRRRAREVRRAPDVAVRQSRHRQDRGDGPRRRPLQSQSRRGECRVPADGARAGRDGTVRQAGDGPARRAAGVDHHGLGEDELHPDACRLGKPAVVRVGDHRASPGPR